MHDLKFLNFSSNMLYGTMQVYKQRCSLLNVWLRYDGLQFIPVDRLAVAMLFHTAVPQQVPS